MLYDNICRFVPADTETSDFNTVNFVLENNCSAEIPSIRSVYAIHLVINGKGIFTRDGKSHNIEKGNIFITEPATRYSVKSTDGLSYAYVSFIGLGASALVKRIAPNFEIIFEHNDSLIPFWLEALDNSNPKNVDLISRGVLEYSVSKLINYAACGKTQGTVAKIKKYIDKNFTDCELGVKSLAKIFNYNEKYLCKLFFRYMGVRFTDYVTSLRISCACSLIEQGELSVKTVALNSGFSDPLYFSKVFKQKMKCSPSAFITQMSCAKTTD